MGKMLSSSWFSSQDALEKVWDLVVPGGIIVIDDFFHKAQGPARQLSAQPGFSALFSASWSSIFNLVSLMLTSPVCGPHYATST